MSGLNEFLVTRDGFLEMALRVILICLQEFCIRLRSGRVSAYHGAKQCNAMDEDFHFKF